MSNVSAMSRLARFAESTQGTPPADAAAWLTHGVRVRHDAESLDVSSFERAQIEDMRNQERVFGSEARIEGLDNPEFPVSVYGTGLGAATISGSQVSGDPAVVEGIELAEHLGHALGGLTRGYSTAVSGGTSTTTVIAVADASNYEPGDSVAIVSTGATGYPAGTAFPRMITAVDTDATPDTITLDQALPAAPSDTDAVHGTATAYVDQSVLCDSNGAGGPYTWSWLIQKGLDTTNADRRETWVARGCVSELQGIALDERNGLLKFPMKVLAGSHADPSQAPSPPPAWTSDQFGLAPLAIGPLTELWVADVGSTTNTNLHVSAMSVEPGVPRVRDEVATSDGTNFQGMAGYVTQPADTTVTVSFNPFSVARWTEQNNGTRKQLRWARLGPAGSGIAVHMPNCSYQETPKRGTSDAVSTADAVFMAHEADPLSTAPTNNERWLSKIKIVMW